MRGFPLLNLLIVIAFFALAWLPLQRLTGKSANTEPPQDQHQAAPGQVEAGFTIRMISSHPLKNVYLDHLGKRLLTIKGIKGPGNEAEIERTINGIIITEPEVEFWIEAELKNAPKSGERPVIQLEMIREGLENTPTSVTIWGQSGESRIETNAMIFLPAISN